ncbi:hypothetical protein [Marinomonas aquiplantarum]|nr:hypothetical protein [Marinomonas aquiplantarum]
MSMTTKKRVIEKLKGPLKELLAKELEAGNEIDTAESEWPRKRSNIWLKQRFHNDYKELYPSLKYRYLGDPRNWIEEYDDPENEEFIAVSASAKV